MRSHLTSRLRAGEPLVGTVIACADPALAEMAAAPFDLAWIDLEHSPIDVGAVPVLAIALRAAGCAAFVRLPGTRFERLGAVLDAGVDGVVVPRVEKPDDAAAVVSRLRYPPAGARGVALRRSAGYGRDQAPPGGGTAPAVVSLVQIESRAAIAAAPAIARVDGVDGLVIGTADLARDLGIQPDLHGDAMRRAMAEVADAADQAGVAFGVAAGGDPQAIVAALARAPRLVVYSADVRIFAQAIDAAALGVREALRSASAP